MPKGVTKQTKDRRELLYTNCRRACLLTNRPEFIKLAPIWLREAGLPVPSSLKTFYNDWDWIMKQELDVSHRRDEAARLITMAEDMALKNEDSTNVLRAAELILKHASPYVERGSRLRDGLNVTADIANNFGSTPPPPAEPPPEVQEWLEDMRRRDGST